MCGRYTLVAPPEAVQELFGAEAAHAAPPRYNIAPSQPILILTEDEPGRRRLVLARWGLIPGWTKDPSTMSLLINARGETAAEKPSFRAAMRHRRCLIPATGFYEWQKRKGTRAQPYFIRPKGGGIVAFAGLWEDWSDPQGGVIDTAAIVTTAASPSLKPIHDRMPAVIRPDDFAMWLDTRTINAKTAASLIGPAPDDAFEAVPVSTAVNAVTNDGPFVQSPIEPESPAAAEAPEETEKKPAAGQIDLFD
ncbi:SOS response-associated peptidase [Amorphus orientalis]|uniref:Abasic site processing protein n=1 Tax=Amorphus orientalis TaxID=649198 RepID=A0AAE3VKV7_9HYPH|nr:SOS response-associated peptidase [Amorphus orientalis]MDQ0314349.1 putative SOS response-associated peptidase YedK [Amorphus orientalis]